MGVGHHEAAWRHPRTDARNIRDVTHFQNLARIAERGKLDSVFFADGLAVGPRIKHNTQSIFEPITLLSALASVTTNNPLRSKSIAERLAAIGDLPLHGRDRIVRPQGNSILAQRPSLFR